MRSLDSSSLWYDARQVSIVGSFSVVAPKRKVCAVAASAAALDVSRMSD